MIRSWIFDLVNISSDDDPINFDVQNCSREYAWHSDLWARAEQLGFHGIFFSEHHFSGARAIPAPGLFAAFVAARTQRLRIGVLGWVLPLWQPWRFLEEVAVLDHLTQGRLEVGVARGSNPAEMAAVGIGESDVVPMFLESLAILERAWQRPGISHRGDYWTYERLQIVPKPLQQPPPIWGHGAHGERGQGSRKTRPQNLHRIPAAAASGGNLRCLS